jgi:kanamycin kinase
MSVERGLPAAVQAIAGDRPAPCVWSNELDGRTFQLDDRFIKWSPRDDLADEIARLRWAIEYVAVPEVLDAGSDTEGSWFITRALDGESAISPRWTADPERAVAGIGRGLRMLHDTLPVEDCPFSWGNEERLRRVHERSGRHDPTLWEPEHRHLTVETALQILEAPPAIDRLVVCHGDACSPNTILRGDGSVAGHVDLGALGAADRWADLAIATWATEWNYGPGWEQPLLDAYGVAPDRQRTKYYRLLWELCP